MIVLVYFLIIALYSLPNFSVSALAGTTFKERLNTYFECESQGIQPGRTCERNFNRFTGEIVNAVTIILYALYPVVNLLFIINFYEIKQRLLRVRSRRRTTRSVTVTNSDNQSRNRLSSCRSP